MSGPYEIIALFALFLWVGFRVGLWRAEWRTSLGIGVVLASALIAFGGVFTQTLLAVFAPLGAVLPALALRDVLGRSGANTLRFSTLEILAFLALYTAFLAASLGVFTFDPYRLGYGANFTAVFALLLLIYTLYRRHFILALGVLAGQAAWVLNWGSSNIFDHFFHAAMIPVGVIVLVARLVRYRS